MRRHPIAIALMLVTLAWGCGQPSQPPTSTTTTTTESASGPQPPAIELRTAKPVDIPASVIPGDGKIPIVVRVREPKKAIERLGEWTSITLSTTPVDLSEKIEQSGFPLSKMQDGKNALVAIWPEQNNKRAGGILPLAPDADLAQLQAQGLQTEQIAGDGVLFGADDQGQGLEQAKLIKDDLLKLAQAAMNTDFEAGIDVQSQWSIYGPMARMMLPGMLSNIGSMQSGEDQQKMNAIQGILTAEANMAMDLLDQARTFTLMANFDSDAVEFSTVLEGLSDAGTTLTAFLSQEPVAAPELTRYLGKNQIVSQMTIRDMGKFANSMIGYMGPMMNDPDAAEKLRQMFAGSEKIGAVHFAMGFTMSPDSPMRTEYIQVPDNAEAYVQFIRDKMGLLNEGPLHDFYTTLDMDMRITTQSTTREYKGYKIEKYLMTFKPGPNASETDRQMMAKMFPGDMPVEYAIVGKYVLTTIGTPVDGLIDRLLSGSAGESAASVKAFPAGANFYIDYDFVGYMRGVREAIPGMSEMNLPENAPPVLIAGYHQQGKAYYLVRVPRGLVEAFANSDEESDEAEPTPAPVQ